MKFRIGEVFVSSFAFAFAANALTPTIITQPQSITVNNASAAAFTVVATNAAAYQWQFQSNNIPGATNATLSLDDVSTNQAGAYTVVITSSDGGSVTNPTPAQLTVVPGTVVQVTFSGYAGGASNSLFLQLFDHDKPATVQNFLHYITAGAFANNMIWDRCVPRFVLQAGGYFAADRTNGFPPDLYSIQTYYTENQGLSPWFPWQVDNEYNVGPVIHNRFGTVAMAKESSGPDTASSAFFFNLADNSTNLDNQNGGFTVFGRILDGTNVLQYFNTLGKPFNGVFDNGAAPFTDLPVNYRGTDVPPGDSNLFFGDFSIVPPAPALDTNPPSLVLLYPTNGATVTNAHVVLQGTASDDVSLARVVVNLTESTNGTFANVFGADAIGTTNWSLDLGILSPGTYNYTTNQIVAQDGAGNFSAPLVGSFIVPQFPFHAFTNGPGTLTLSTNLNPTNLNVGSRYAIVAKPLKGCLFVCWSNAWGMTFNPSNSFIFTNGTAMTAFFVSNTLAGDLSFKSPTANQKLTNGTVTLAGKIVSTNATVTCQIFSQSTSNAVTAPITTTASNTWSIPPQQLAPGSYIAQAVARDTRGRCTVVSEEFTVLAPLSVTILGHGTTSPTNGAFLQVGTDYTVKATPAASNSFFAWLGSSFISISPSVTFSMSDGAAITAVFVSNTLPKGSLSIVSPAANATVATNVFTVSGHASAALAGGQITCQLFTNSVMAGIAQLAAISGTNWTLPMNNLPQAAYTLVVVASDPLGRTTLATQSFTVNYYPNIAGTYEGLMIGTNSGGTNEITATNSGYFSLTLTKTGSFSSDFYLPFLTIPVIYAFGATGSLPLSAGYKSGTNTIPVTLNLTVDLTNGTYQITGDLVFQGWFTNSILGYRVMTKLSTNTTPAIGKYVLDISPVNPSNAPAADSYATVSVASTGTSTVSGTLADDSTFLQYPGVSKDGVWPLYYKLYSGKGLLIGWQTNTASNTCIGQLTWIKPKIAGTYYTNGFTEELTDFGARYVPPVTNTQYQIIFQSGTLTNSVTNLLTVNKYGQFVPATGPTDTDKLSISLSSAGVLTGSIYNTADKKTLQFAGAFISPSEGGSGFVLDTDGQTGSFQIGLLSR